ncbi:MAG TPA: DedA family protein/thiosulfate sulfurtransferase GlpE [Burkholderiales bacterium]|nr:DedA family protein/thiosulfate sulfurtransferase GlpE [Burkholderiales bacterium]
MFGVVLLEQLGVPLPALPVVVLAGARGIGDPSHLLYALVLATLGSTIGDLAWFWAGRRYGHRVLRLLCRLSLSPDSCVRQTESTYERRGAATLVIAKFVPGLATVAPPVAGALGLRLSAFLVYTSAGAALYYGAALVLGLVFHNQIDWLLERLTDLGVGALLVVVALLALYVAYRWWDRSRFIQSLRAGRIEADELSGMIGRGEEPIVLDVRSRTHRELDRRRIPGARGVDLDDLERTLAEIPRDREVVVYCACPNEVTAIKVAMLLRDRGFERVRPLAGGIDGWIAAGQGIETA